MNGRPIIQISTQQTSGSSFIPNNTKKSNHNFILLVPLEDINNPYFPLKFLKYLRHLGFGMLWCAVDILFNQISVNTHISIIVFNYKYK